jgi:hypothetical protein
VRRERKPGTNLKFLVSKPKSKNLPIGATLCVNETTVVSAVRRYKYMWTIGVAKGEEEEGLL